MRGSFFVAISFANSMSPAASGQARFPGIKVKYILIKQARDK